MNNMPANVDALSKAIGDGSLREEDRNMLIRTLEAHLERLAMENPERYEALMKEVEAILSQLEKEAAHILSEDRHSR
jgi:hypothetical protein